MESSDQPPEEMSEEPPKNSGLDSTIDTEANDRGRRDSKDIVEPHSPTKIGSKDLSWENQSSDSDERIGRYILLDKLGSGSYGTVYRARDEGLGRFVALKLLTRFSSASNVDAWLSEARVLASLDHPSVVPVFDIGKSKSGQPYIVSKLIAGGALGDRIKKVGCTVDDAVRIAVQLADALDYLHRKGVMHRDIKPGNILTTPEGDAILADFGLALDETGYGKGARFVGTPAYMSPEQARSEGHRVDGRSDIYSLGVVFYELLTGTRPFKADNQDDLLDCIRNIEVRPLRQLNPTLPRELERICLRALAKKISDRYSTAGDLANDLRSWKTSPGGHSTVAAIATAQSATPSAIDQPDSKASQKSLDISNVAVVPHGLRPFDSGDADFFNFLLPGARDRNGVPDCVSFWTNRIASRNPADTFRVGVLLGPSGSGKSSMIRAGVLPLVKDQVQSIYIEAKPELLEANLHKQLRHELPTNLTGGTLRETMIRVRQSNKERHGKKLVIVIDQFEQWLNHHRSSDATELHEALRQCDGENIQAVLLVRDDFMLGLTAFMDQLEEYLLQNQNFATVEPFGELHAKRVLSAFGRAYGTLRDELTRDQEAFLDEAVGELARAGRLAPVQIAVLSEMTKDKPWTAATLKNLGGIEGLGVAFLEERLAGSSAHPLMRSELPVVRRILTEMLPLDDTVIKPPACAQSVLLDRLGGIASEDMLRKLLNLLDTEVRLITPTSSTSLGNSGTGSTMGSTNSDPAYQLTHDYLVPTTRKWLESLDAGTRAGRVRQQLREMGVAWNAKPTAKRLPSLFEWSAIRWFVKPTEWNNQERRMMRATEWRLGQLAALGITSVFLVGCMAFLAFREMHTQGLVDRLLDADTGNVSTVLRAIEPYRASVLPRLDNAKVSDADPQIAVRSKLHIALAKFEQDPNEAAFVLDQLHLIEDRHLGSIVNYLRDRKAIDDEQLLAKVNSALTQSAPNALALSALFASRQPDHQAWPTIASDVCKLLIRKRNPQISFWPELMLPVREHLVPVLVGMIESSSAVTGSELDNHFLFVSSFAKDDPATIARVAGYCSPESLSSLLDNKSSPMQLSVELREQLAKATDRNRNKSIDATLDKKLRDYGGQLAANCGWAVQVPWTKLTEVTDLMRAGGFSPTAIRPFQLKNELFAAMSWVKEPNDCFFELDLKSDELKKRFSELQEQGAFMIDFAEYPSSESAEKKWIGLWQRSTQTTTAIPQLLTLENDEILTDGYQEFRVWPHIQANGDRSKSVLWNRSENTKERAATWSRLQRSAGDLFPGFCQSDLRFTSIVSSNYRGINWSNYYTYLDKVVDKSKPTAREKVLLCTALSACGEVEKALEQLSSINDEDFTKLPQAQRATTQRGAQRQLARAYARLGKTEELQKLLDEAISTGEFTQGEKDFFYLRLALLKNEDENVTKLLLELERAADQSNYSDEYYLRSLALVASANFPDGMSDTAMQKLLARAPQSLAKNEDLQADFMDVDFDGVRQLEPWQKLLDSMKLGRLVTMCGDSSEDQESRTLFSPTLTEHSNGAGQLCDEEFVPTCLNVLADASGQLQVNSLWKRPKPTEAELAARSQRIAILSLALAKVGDVDALRDGLEEKWGCGVQSAIVSFAPRVLPADRFATLLQDASRVSLQSAIVSTLGGYFPTQLSDENRRYVSLRIEDWANNATESTLLSTSRWCLKQWKVEALKPLSQPLVSKDRNWFTTSIGQQMVVIEPPQLVLIGKNGERRIWVHIGRKFAIGANEVTGEEYTQFLNDPRVVAWIARDKVKRNIRPADPEYPQLASWLHAIRYCQWLTEREQIPESQWCYKNVWNDDDKIAFEPDYLNRTGYRLPTLAEREWACGAGTSQTWHFGDDESLLQNYEWTLPHSNNRIHATALKRPNNFGLFDMSGNLAEWVDNVASSPTRPSNQYFINDTGNETGIKNQTAEKNRVLSGGRFKFSSQSAATATSVFEEADYLSTSTGFRIARTISNK